MDQVVFKIPNKVNKNDNKALFQNPNREYVKSNEYTKITENLYKFEGVSLDINNIDIYILFNLGLQYRQNGNTNEALSTFKLCENKIDNNTRKDIIYEIYLNIALINTELHSSFEVILEYYNKVMKICPDRSEPYYYLSLYCNQHKYYDKSYELLTYAIKNITYDNVSSKYNNIQKNAYEKFLYDELSVACYWLGKYEESIKYIECVINDPDFSNIKQRLNNNIMFAKKQLNKE